MTHYLKAALLGGVAMLGSTAAAAQQAPVETAETHFGEIVVTAQRRAQRLEDVPISITALSAERMEKAGVVGVLDLPRITPGLEMPMNGAFLQPTIRGVSSGGSDVGDSSNVALYIDGVYQHAQGAQLLDLPDVETVEILKGPQGTLYGQNAEGGAIIVNTHAPTFTNTGKLSLSYGNYDDFSARGYVSGPISDTLAFSLSGAYQDRRGFRDDLISGGHDAGLRSSLIRGKLLFKPTDDVSFTLTGYSAKRSDSASFAGQALHRNSVGYALFPNSPFPSGPDETALSFKPDQTNELWGLNLNGQVKTGLGVLSSITSYSGARSSIFVDLDYSPAWVSEVGIDVRSRYFTQELNFVSRQLGRFTFTGGGFLSIGREVDDPQVFIQHFPVTLAPNGPGPAAFDGEQFTKLKKTILAAYAEASYDVTDALTVTAGARYTYERQRAYSDLFGFVPEPIPSAYNPATFEKFTPRVTLRYAVAPGSNVYASYSQGFKSGIVSANAIFSPPVEPEELTAYEVGYKGRLLGPVRLNVAAFHYDYKNIQVQRFVAPATVYENAASSRLQGLDFELNIAATPELTLSFGGVVLDGEYRRYPLAGVFVPDPAGGNANATVDVSGKRMIRAPKFTGTATANYVVETSTGTFGAFAAVYYNDGSKLEASGRIRQKSYMSVDGELSWSPTEQLRLVAWGRNLGDDAHIEGILPTNFADGVAYSAPRTFGVRAEYQF